MKYPARPFVNERPNYEPAGPQEEFIVPLLRRHIENALAAYAAPTPAQAKALDVGCGRQPFRSALEAIGYCYTGMDAQQNPEGTVHVIAAIDESLPEGLLRCGPFHFVLCTEVMEHVADWDRAFANLATLMAPSARLLITCPHFYQLHEEPYDFWRPTLHALSYYACRAGFKTLRKEAAGDAWDVLGTLLADCHAVSTSNDLLARGITRLVSLSQRWLFRSLCKGQLRQLVHLRSSLYLSNIVVFERP